MSKILNLGGFLSLIYFWYNFQNWTLSANDSNLLSQKLVKILTAIPSMLISFIIIILLITLIVSYLFNLQIFLVNQISKILLFLLTVIAMNMLMLEETTTLYLIKIHHPIGVEYKIKYFEYMLYQIVESSNKLYLWENHLIKIDPNFYNELKTMNVTQIHNKVIEFAQKINMVDLPNQPENNTKGVISFVIVIISLFLLATYTPPWIDLTL